MRHRTWPLASTLVAMLTFGAGLDRPAGAAPAQALVGVWVLNPGQSDAESPSQDGERERSGRGDGAPGGRVGGGRGGGFGRGGVGGGRGAGGRGSPDDIQRMRTAMREIFDAPPRMTIVETDAMVIITGADGRTIRLSTNGEKVKDESTGIERKTRRDGEKLMTEISGAGASRITETYEIEAETGRLRRTVQVEGDRENRLRRRQVYDRES